MTRSGEMRGSDSLNKLTWELVKKTRLAEMSPLCFCWMFGYLIWVLFFVLRNACWSRWPEWGRGPSDMNSPGPWPRGVCDPGLGCCFLILIAMTIRVLPVTFCHEPCPIKVTQAMPTSSTNDSFTMVKT